MGASSGFALTSFEHQHGDGDTEQDQHTHERDGRRGLDGCGAHERDQDSDPGKDGQDAYGDQCRPLDG